MSAVIIDGKQVAKDIREEIKVEVERLTQQGVRPGLAVILIGEDPASQSYVKAKAKACEEAGIYSSVIRKNETITESELLQLIDELNGDESIHGILVQLPLPKHISEEAVIQAIHPAKDVDGFHPINVGNMVIGADCYLPCTPHGVVELIKRTGTSISGKHAVVVGRSNIVGKPVSMLLLQENATVSICHSRTKNLADITRQADILVVAVGKAHMIGAEHVAPGAIVIDVGVNRVEGNKLVGDVRFDEVKEIAGFITPVPGGVGPMTITMLLKNTVEAAKKKMMA
ncbi:bifunctional methylenetetrahydrofolate dehydrogenase/methenyltetrahydrofolate cyclohydrolase FolD [Ammoniphilus sp. CFH 90114]|uniref:bifunctional methylenetetrahydrofolate dehydrogenase/methenyltetrahydrofolate cyclohydrolase FolD n=1 Tax=Ammoniphilus sp. CFH 90114 TaxID=2493665 RepID=UPI00100E156C|nr:bifunctional methylenetetrahydrofolate dehydrogenase/methenyltetrahydrofolate cyclohydrolase FolD [Ammoniphilus sp. CFH 90114]RXT13788.1 bifunctional methylenetetrahydrofolate dehydrogenase/methenyltetrahydrofolate cyclohydrolase FolD [Ammoniphilus sp. CFH 90114]